MSSSNNKSPSGLVIAATSAVAATAALVIYHWDSAIGAPHKLKNVKSAPGLIPVIGHGIQIIQNLHRFHDSIDEIMQANNYETTAVHIPFNPPFIFFGDPKIVEHVLKTNFTTYDKGPFFRERCHDVLGHGIFNVDGESWRSQRKTAANIFNVKNFKDFVGVTFAEEMDTLSSVLTKTTTAKSTIDLADLFFRFTLDSFCKIGFGIDLHCMTHPGKVPFAAAFDDAQNRMMKRFVIPTWRLEELFMPIGKEHRKHVETIKEFGRGIVRQRKKELEESGGEKGDRNDLLTLLMTMKDTDGNATTEDNLVDYILNFIIAGRDTTAQALSWCFYLLHKNPRVTAALLAEIDSTLTDPSAPPTYEQIKNMEYANAVFHETLRLYPSVPSETKQANKDDTLPDGTFVPKGTIVAWSLYSMGRTPAIWGPTAKEFRPERWLEMTKQPSSFDYPVFNAGPRVCLGKNMAELEGVFVLVSMLRNFKVDVVNADEVTYANSLTLPMKDGLMCKISKREV
ncbi:hypothetical protein HDV05_007093 [Chytridiales sp. JEL 0842]|nr:hypothetical protein HDV05_007093 [Chytridiales sp. JEL 0842]